MPQNAGLALCAAEFEGVCGRFWLRLCLSWRVTLAACLCRYLFSEVVRESDTEEGDPAIEYAMTAEARAGAISLLESERPMTTESATVFQILFPKTGCFMLRPTASLGA